MQYYYLYYGSLILLIPGIIFALVCQFAVQLTFKKYSAVSSMNGITGKEAARKVLDMNDVDGVTVNAIKGSLTDHYDPRDKTLNLSEPVYDSTSVAAIGVAAHEAGHAVQDSENYIPLKIRGAIVPVVNIGTRLAVPVAILGIIIEWFARTPTMEHVGTYVLAVGILMYSLTAIFALITLPVEINASRRAVNALIDGGMIAREEKRYVKKVLTAAAMTYVASLAISLLYLLRFLIIISGSRKKK